MTVRGARASICAAPPLSVASHVAPLLFILGLVAVGVVALSLAQAAGVPGACRVGFPVGKFHGPAAGGAGAAPTESGGVYVVADRSALPSGVVGVVERGGGGARARCVTDANATLAWAAVALLASLAAVVSGLSVARGDLVFGGGCAFIALLSLSALVRWRRRAGERASALAGAAGLRAGGPTSR